MQLHRLVRAGTLAGTVTGTAMRRRPISSIPTDAEYGVVKPPKGDGANEDTPGVVQNTSWSKTYEDEVAYFQDMYAHDAASVTLPLPQQLKQQQRRQRRHLDHGDLYASTAPGLDVLVSSAAFRSEMSRMGYEPQTLGVWLEGMRRGYNTATGFDKIEDLKWKVRAIEMDYQDAEKSSREAKTHWANLLGREKQLKSQLNILFANQQYDPQVSAEYQAVTEELKHAERRKDEQQDLRDSIHDDLWREQSYLYQEEKFYAEKGRNFGYLVQFAITSLNIFISVVSFAIVIPYRNKQMAENLQTKLEPLFDKHNSLLDKFMAQQQSDRDQDEPQQQTQGLQAPQADAQQQQPQGEGSVIVKHMQELHSQVTVLQQHLQRVSSDNSAPAAVLDQDKWVRVAAGSAVLGAAVAFILMQAVSMSK